MKKTRGVALHDVMVEKYRKGQVTIGVNRSFLLTTYSQLSGNPLVKVFHLIVCLYTFPITIVGVVGVLAYYHRFLWIAGYLGGVIVLLALEQYLSHKITINSALKNHHTFSDLVKRGIIKIKDTVDPDTPA
jgi:fatty-acid desaturase